MDLKSPNLVYEQLDTYETLFSTELPKILKHSPVFGNDPTLRHLQTVYVIGDGDSLYAAIAVEYAFRHISGVEYIPVPAFEFTQYSLQGFTAEKARRSILIGVSASGGSPFVVDAMQKYRAAFPDCPVVSICGKVGGEIEKNANKIFSVQLNELGRTPGIRTYSASMVGLLAIACEIAEARGFNGSITRKELEDYIVSSAVGVRKTIIEADEKTKDILNLFDGSFITFVGSGPSHGTALFEAAKIVETSGIYAYGQDLEEWNHVEGFAYPVESMLVIHPNIGQAFKRAENLAKSAQELGHKIVLVAHENHAKEIPNDCILTVYGPYNDFLSPLSAFIPFTFLSAKLAEKLGRAMFHTDTDIWGRL